ncbi:hypothetical protein HORIV_38640 [Vreelandella olivaria]|uniref:Uncharacterized protein n=1 Tax=Vreelandella olivaria TaxID=390919 RepID=A0ABM8HL22_9GAMM|nr:hypothetical protein HORIV_38640 [Halomonas olivaria]
MPVRRGHGKPADRRSHHEQDLPATWGQNECVGEGLGDIIEFAEYNTAAAIIRNVTDFRHAQLGIDRHHHQARVPGAA